MKWPKGSEERESVEVDCCDVCISLYGMVWGVDLRLEKFITPVTS